MPSNYPNGGREGKKKQKTSWFRMPAPHVPHHSMKCVYKTPELGGLWCPDQNTGGHWPNLNILLKGFRKFPKEVSQFSLSGGPRGKRQR